MALFRARWWAAANRDEPAFDRIEADLYPARWAFRHEPGMWYQALIHAAELSCLAGGKAARQLSHKAESLLKEEPEFELRFARSLEQLDLARELARCRNEFDTSREQRLMRLAIRGLVGDERELRGELVAEILPWETAPAEGLELLDELAERHPAFAFLIRDQVHSYASDRGTDSSGTEDEQEEIAEVLARESELLTALATYFYGNFLGDSGNETRLRLLAFCRREGIRLATAVEALHKMSVAGPTQNDALCHRLLGDAPLAAVIDGCWALWHI
jgi:hypothetical protein